MFSQRSLCCFDLVSGKYLRWWSNLRWQGYYLCNCGGLPHLDHLNSLVQGMLAPNARVLIKSYFMPLWSNGGGACWIHNLHKQKPQFIQEMWCALGLLSFVPTITHTSYSTILGPGPSGERRLRAAWLRGEFRQLQRWHWRGAGGGFRRWSTLTGRAKQTKDSDIFGWWFGGYVMLLYAMSTSRLGLV